MGKPIVQPRNRLLVRADGQLQCQARLILRAGRQILAPELLLQPRNIRRSSPSRSRGMSVSLFQLRSSSFADSAHIRADRAEPLLAAVLS